MIKAVIFDCFGVLTESTHNRFYTTYFADAPEKVARARELDDAANKGLMSLDAFHKNLSELAGISVRDVEQFVSQHVPNVELLRYIQDSLKPAMKIGFLSNVADNILDVLFTPEQQALFDDVVLSYQVGMAKPEAAIFELAAARLGVDVSECVFVDDIQQYVDGARLAGMQAILYTDFNRFKKDIETTL